MNQQRFDRRIPSWRGGALVLLGGASLIAFVALVVGRSEQPTPPVPAANSVAPRGDRVQELALPPVAFTVAPSDTARAVASALPDAGASPAASSPPSADPAQTFRAQLQASPAFPGIERCVSDLGADSGLHEFEILLSVTGSVRDVSGPEPLRRCILSAARGFKFQRADGSAPGELTVMLPVAGLAQR
jgi:hypothetical protein